MTTGSTMVSLCQGEYFSPEKPSWKTLPDNGHLSAPLDKDMHLCSEPDDHILTGLIAKETLSRGYGCLSGTGDTLSCRVEEAGH